MGTYTAIFGDVIVKQDVAKCLGLGELDGGLIEWERLLTLTRLRRHPDVIAFLNSDRSGSIGNGGGGMDMEGVASDILALLDNPYVTPRRTGKSNLIRYLSSVLINFVDSLSSVAKSGGRPLSYSQHKRKMIFYSTHKNYAQETERFFRIAPLLFDGYALGTMDEDRGLRYCICNGRRQDYAGWLSY